MFALFLKRTDGRLDFLCDAKSEPKAMLMGRYWSRASQHPVLAFENQADGTTRLFCQFERGKLVADEGALHAEASGLVSPPPIGAVNGTARV
jgi:hypothetical protein